MTIEEMYQKLLEEARNPDPALYDAYRSAIVSHIDEVLGDMPGEAHAEVLPFNFRERMDYILSRPYQYHSIIQLKALHDEFIKKSASYRIRKSR
ncbi:YpoC family protein [Salinicoccus bachuensis]|uniref:YpoC family protein n=1 Tax=Salinicoccus bachuensis TaxID=3136731 RepID=A0ABZ3CFE5_9STAP